jgi:hypothetical protein
MMKEPTIIGVCHFCGEDVDEWDGSCKREVLTWKCREALDAKGSQTIVTWERVVKEVLFCNKKCQEIWARGSSTLRT